MENLNYPTFAISPVDGRYNEQTLSLRYVFSEFALMKNRLFVETEYLIYLIPTLVGAGYKHIKKLKKEQVKAIRGIHEKFSENDFDEIKKFESIANHDVRAVEYFLRAKLQSLKMEQYVPFVHWGLTS